MKVNHVLGLIALVTVPLTAGLAGCSSSSSTTFPDAGGSGGGSGGSSGGTGSSSSSGGFGSSSSGTTGSSSGGGSSSSGTTSSGTDAGGGTCTALTTVPASMIPAYAAPAKVSACSMAQINGFVMACTGTTGSPTACMSFTGTAANMACVACLAPMTKNTGALLSDSAGNVWGLNAGGCVALADPSNGPACAMALTPLFQCEHAACNSAACQGTDTTVCQNSADTGACAMELMAANTACGADFSDGGVGTTTCGTALGVITEICGNGM